MNKVADGEFHHRIPVETNDEIGQIAEDFNVLIGRIDELVNDSVRRETLQKDTELKALQFQINPHFIYNTIDTLRMRLILANEDEIADSMADFGKLIRYNISGDPLVRHARRGDREPREVRRAPTAALRRAHSSRHDTSHEVLGSTGSQVPSAAARGEQYPPRHARGRRFDTRDRHRRRIRGGKLEHCRQRQRRWDHAASPHRAAKFSEKTERRSSPSTERTASGSAISREGSPSTTRERASPSR